MNHKALGIVLLGITPFVAGCKPSAERSATETRDTTVQQFDKVKQETKEAAQEMKDYAYAQKVEFVATMQGELDTINRDLDQLEAKLEKLERRGQGRSQTQNSGPARADGQADEAT